MNHNKPQYFIRSLKLRLVSRNNTVELSKDKEKPTSNSICLRKKSEQESPTLIKKRAKTESHINRIVKMSANQELCKILNTNKLRANKR